RDRQQSGETQGRQSAPTVASAPAGQAACARPSNRGQRVRAEDGCDVGLVRRRGTQSRSRSSSAPLRGARQLPGQGAGGRPRPQSTRPTVPGERAMSAAFRAGVVAFALALIVLAATLPSRAAAAFGPIELISKSSREQAQFATEPALSADGRYVAFCGELGGHEGIFREQRDNGSIVPVAVGPFSFERCYESGRYANAPSISADGRYIAFTTAAPLVEADEEPETNDVYIADMATSPPTYTLVSAVDGSAEPMPGAAFSAGRVAMSADANRVAFVDEGNVYVREISTRRTILISAKREPLTGMTDEPIV